MSFHPTRDRLAPDLTDREQIVLLARALWREGYDDHLAGHITVNLGDGTLLCNPWLLTWDEFGPEDVIRIDLDGNVVEGDWPAPLGIPLHLELHKARPGIGWAIHNHSRWGTVWSDMGGCPRSRTRPAREAVSSCSSTSTTAASATWTRRRRRSRRWATPSSRCSRTTACSCSVPPSTRSTSGRRRSSGGVGTPGWSSRAVADPASGRRARHLRAQRRPRLVGNWETAVQRGAAARSTLAASVGVETARS